MSSKETKSDTTKHQKDSIASHDTPVHTYMVVPPDGGWGWVVVAASFACNLVVDGIIYSFGMFLGVISESFGESKAKVSLVGSLLSGFYLMEGPFVSALANRYGFRTVSIIGSVLGGLSFVVSSFSTSVEFLYVSYGIMGGIGFGLIYVPAVITTGFYFERWRALATGIAVCGSGIGTFIFAPFSTYLIETVGWRGALLIQAGLIFNCAVFGAMFRPLAPVRVNISNNAEHAEIVKEKEGEKSETEKLPLLLRIKLARESLQAESMQNLDHEIEITSTTEDVVDANHHLKVNNNIKYPTAIEVIAASTKNLKELKESNQSLYDSNHHIKSVSASERKLNIMELKPESKANGMPRHRPRAMSSSSTRSRRNTGASGVRPLYRDDIFFGASLTKLPQYSSQVSSLNYTLSVTRLPTYNDVMEEQTKSCKLCPEAVKRTLKTMLDTSLLSSPSFLILCISGFITMMGFYVPFMYIKERAVLTGMASQQAMLLVSVIGITNTVGRVVCGLVTSIPGANSLLINNVALTVCGASTILSNISSHTTYQFAYASVFGLSISCFASLRSIVIVDLVGLEKLTNAFGLLLLFQGVAAAIGAPLAGVFMDMTGNYDTSFYLSGGMILISGIMCYPLAAIKRWEQSKAKSQMPLMRSES
uniref:Monocarboxylate transporter 12 n=1 Tax=Cacopsylla melanoneura TaxID=428564 RepID=A0A8D9BUH3_9HEMI